MTWFLLALLSALLLGCYDVCKKLSLDRNAVVPVLLINTVLCALFSGIITLLRDPSSLFPPQGIEEKALVLVGVKACIVLGSWLCGYLAIKHLPLTLVGPVNATRPVLVLVGAIGLFGERLNGWQWAGVALAIIAFFMLKRSSNREGISWTHNRWVAMLVLATLLSTASGLYDKYLLSPTGAALPPLFVQTYFNAMQAVLMIALTALLWLPRCRQDVFQPRLSILGVSLFLTAADMVYFHALALPGALIIIVSMVRRCSVFVSFAFGAFVLKEKNLRAKFLDLILLLLSLLLLAWGAQAQ